MNRLYLEESMRKKLEEYKASGITDIVELRIKLIEFYKNFNFSDVDKCLKSLKLIPKQPKKVKRIDATDKTQLAEYEKNIIKPKSQEEIDRLLEKSKKEGFDSVKSWEFYKGTKIYDTHKYLWQCLKCEFVHKFRQDAELCYDMHNTERRIFADEYNLKVTDENRNLFNVGDIIDFKLCYKEFFGKMDFGLFRCEIIRHEIVERFTQMGNDDSWHLIEVKVLKRLE